MNIKMGLIGMVLALGGCGTMSPPMPNDLNHAVPTPDLSPTVPAPQYPQRDTLLHTRIDTRNAIAPLNAAATVKLARAIADTNQLRAEKGLPPLKVDPILSAYAQQRAQEIVGKFAHQRPNGQMSSEGYGGWRAAGENIAAGNASADDTVLDQWRNSSGHYANIVSKDFKDIGMGYVHVPNSEYRDYWTQIFGTKMGHSYNSEAFFYLPPDWDKLSQSVHFDASGKIQTFAESEPLISRPLNGFNTAVFENPTLSEFQYQTFGRIEGYGQRPMEYFNLGRAVRVPPEPHFSALYRGFALGDIDGEKTKARVKAELNFDEARRELELTIFNVTDSQGHGRESFNAHLQWQQDHFSAPQGTEAYFFGPHFEEIGGHFIHKTEAGKTYRGAFGASRVP